MPPYGSCNLGSINLARFVKNPYTESAEVDWERLGEVTRTAVRFLDNVIDANKFPLEQIARKARADRRIGLGVMGWAEMLVQMGLPYDSDEAVALARKVMTFIKHEAAKMSVELAEERGAYPEWEGSKWHQAGIKVRNATLTTVAPTGTISLFAAQPHMPCSGGIEPKFALVFTRNQAGSLMLDVDGQFADVARREGWYSEELMKRVADHGTARGVEGVPERWQRIFATAHDVAPEWHVRMQAAFQGSDDLSVLDQPVDAAVSKTVNLPHSASVEDVAKIYSLAWDLGLKGITVYRNGSRGEQVLTVGDQTKQAEPKQAEPKQAEKPAGEPASGSGAPARWLDQPLTPRPEIAPGVAINIETHFGRLSADFHLQDGEVFETMFNVGAAGSDLMADAAGMGRLISVILRMKDGVPLDQRLEIVREKLCNIGGSGSYGFGPNRVRSLPMAIARAIERMQHHLESVRNGESAGLGVPDAESGEEPAPPVRTSRAHDHLQTGDQCEKCGNFSMHKYDGCVRCFTPGCDNYRCQ